MMLGSNYRYCAACNTHYLPACGEEEWHERCPHECTMCGQPITGRDDGCPGHYMNEWRAHYDKIRKRPHER